MLVKEKVVCSSQVLTAALQRAAPAAEMHLYIGVLNFSTEDVRQRFQISILTRIS